MKPKQSIAFVKANGVVLESGRGPVPSLAEAIAGKPIRGSWWAHPKANIIFLCSRAIRRSADVLVCRLVGGKVTYVHRCLWPALVRLAGLFDADRLAMIDEIHTRSGSPLGAEESVHCVRSFFLHRGQDRASVDVTVDVTDARS